MEYKRLVDYPACPLCDGSWIGTEIPEENRHYYGGATHTSKLIGIYSMDEDRTVAWECPHCGERFERGYGGA